MTSFIQTNQTVILPDANYSVSVADSGKLMLLPAITGARVISLPPVASGLRYRFMLTGAIAALSSVTLTPTNAAGVAVLALVYGVLINNVAQTTVAVVPKAAADTVVMNTLGPISTYVDCISDGTRWYVSGLSKLTNILA